MKSILWKPAVLLAALFIVVPLTSCSDDDPKEDLRFVIEQESTDFVKTYTAGDLQLTIRSNGHWIPIVEGDVDWIRLLIQEGKDDGYFKFRVRQNTEPSERNATITFNVDGELQPQKVTVKQLAYPSLEVTEGTDFGTLTSQAGTYTVTVSANYEWNYTATPANDWLTVVPGAQDNQLSVSVTANPGQARTGTLNIVLKDYSAFSYKINVQQAGDS